MTKDTEAEEPAQKVLEPWTPEKFAEANQDLLDTVVALRDHDTKHAAYLKKAREKKTGLLEKLESLTKAITEQQASRGGG